MSKMYRLCQVVALIVFSFMIVTCEPVPKSVGPDGIDTVGNIPADNELIGIWFSEDTNDYVNFINNKQFHRWTIGDDFVFFGIYEISRNEVLRFHLQGYMTNQRQSRSTFGVAWTDHWVVEYRLDGFDAIELAGNRYEKVDQLENVTNF